MAIGIIIVICLVILTAYYLLMWPKSTFFGFYPYGIKTDKKVIALSFDDGPSSPYTSDLISILNKYNVKATFFLVGKNLEKAPELGRLLVSSGHIIANHAYSHKLFKYISDPSLKSEINKTQEIIFNTTGKHAALFRSPWLIRHSGLMRNIKANKLTPISGIFGTEKEALLAKAEVIYRDAVKQIAPGRIMIFHDGVTKNGNRSETIKAIDRLIPELKKQGYEIVTVDQLLGIPAYN